MDVNPQYISYGMKVAVIEVRPADRIRNILIPTGGNR
jgi:hypothetical protein